MRAYLIAPFGTPEAIDAASDSFANALVLDHAGITASAGATSYDPASSHRRIRFFVRIGALESPNIAADLSAAIPLRPDAIVVPAAHGCDIAHLGARLAVAEAENGWPDGATRIIALVASATGALKASSLADASPRLAGIAWDPGAIAADLGARQLLDEAGGWSAPLAQVRGVIRLAAAAARVEAIEAAYPGDAAGFTRHLAAAHRDGFGAVLTTSASQIPLIREA